MEVDVADDQATAQDVFLKGRPSKAQFTLFPKKDPMLSNLRAVYLPLQIFFFPVVFYSSWTFASAADSVLLSNITQAFNFAEPPYNFSTAIIGYTNFAFFIGALVAIAFSGVLTDYVSAIQTKRNKGIREPEMRLVMIIFYYPVMLVALIILALGYQRKWAWEVIVILGYGMIGFTMVAVPAVTLTYAIDSYPQIPGEVLLTGTLCKNTLGFSMTYWVPDWLATGSFEKPIFTFFGLVVFFGLLTIPVYLFGRKFRRWTANSKVHSIAGY